jgi:hypothetical protein
MRISVLLLVLPLLAGCSDIDWNHLTSFGSPSDDAADPAGVASAAPAAAAPVPGQTSAASSPAAPNAFCLGVARQDATGNGFDTATQQRVAQRSYAQCVVLFAGQN